MDVLEVARRYIDAWNRHDASGIAALFADGGTYTDPTTEGELQGDRIAAYAGSLFEAFPDLSFETRLPVQAGDGAVAFEWVMTGRNTGSFHGLPPTGREIAVTGGDFAEVEGGRIRRLRGHFDAGAVPRQLGFRVVVQPESVGPARLGTSTYLPSGKRTKPGAFSLTSLEARSDEEVAKIREYSRAMLPEIAGLKGFLGLTTAAAGRRLFTAAAWESPEDPRQMFSASPAHDEAVAAFFGPDLCSGGVTSVWVPQRFNTLWVRCGSCGRMADAEAEDGKCACGETLPEPPAFW
jgi:steroid delta-isomerase-like uncharacterized protein